MTIQCSKCHYTANTRDNMLSHILYKHTEPKPWACAEQACNRTFPRRDELKKHVNDDHKRHQFLPSELQRDNVIYNRVKDEAANCATVQNQNSNPPVAGPSSAAAPGPAPMQPAPQSSSQPAPPNLPAPFADQPDKESHLPSDSQTIHRPYAMKPGYYDHSGATWDLNGHIPGAGRHEWYDDEE